MRKKSVEKKNFYQKQNIQNFNQNYEQYNTPLRYEEYFLYKIKYS